MIVAGTGHRELRDRDWTADKIEKALIHLGASRVYVGMASGFDLLLAKTAYGLGIPFIATKPWAGHRPRKADTYDYERAIQLATEVVDVIPEQDYPGAWVYQARNEFMVDNSNHVLAMYEGINKGGTFNCIKYARKTGKTVTTINPLTKGVTYETL